MLAFRLPVSEDEVVLHHPTGAEDILLSEAGSVGVRLALALVSALARDAEGGPLDWPSRPVTDLDATLLRLRQLVVGDVIRSTALCPNPDCRSRIDLSFRVGEFLEYHRPEPRSDVVPAGEPGWLRFGAGAGAALEGALFRLPSCADLVAVATHPRGESELSRRCVQPAGMDEDARRRVEEAMEALAPSLYSDLDGACPGCAGIIKVPFDPQGYVLRELRARAQSIYEDIDLLAATYHWSERDVLAMPQVRRARYAELIADRREA